MELRPFTPSSPANAAPRKGSPPAPAASPDGFQPAPSEESSWWQRTKQLAASAGGAAAGLTTSAIGVSLLAHPLLSSTADPRVQVAAGLGIATVTLVGGACGAVLGWNLTRR